MLQQTALRVAAPAYARPLVVAGEGHRFFIKRQLADASITPAAIILEPEPRDTASVAALACEWLLANGAEEEVVLLLPSDHLIADVAAFHAAVEIGRVAADKAIVAFGVEPHRADTQYGYIEAEILDGNEQLRRITRFVEKPDHDTAVRLASSGRHFWNAGLYMFQPRLFLSELERHRPGVREAVAAAMSRPEVDGSFIRPDPIEFAQAEKISIDYAVMERTGLGLMIPVAMNWSDVGSWKAVWEASAKDADSNMLAGNAIAMDCANSLIRSECGTTVAAVGLNDMVVVATSDAVFVAPMAQASDVKQLVERLDTQARNLSHDPAKVERPWGSYEALGEGARFQIKHIIVGPGEQLSLQMHYHRAEHWVVVRGTAEVTVGDQVSLLQENQSTYIPAGTRHRLRNPGRVPLELVEVQCGPYLGEDDIVRFEDVYGRG